MLIRIVTCLAMALDRCGDASCSGGIASSSVILATYECRASSGIVCVYFAYTIVPKVEYVDLSSHAEPWNRRHHHM